MEKIKIIRHLEELQSIEVDRDGEIDKKEIDESAHSFYKTAITDLREKLKKDNRYIANMEWTEDQVSGDLCLYITTNPLPLERHKNDE